MNDVEALSILAGDIGNMARDLVGKSGGYRPFGGMVDADGKPALIFDEGSLTGGDPERSLERLLMTLRGEAASGKWQAVGLANMAHVETEDGGQQIAIVISMHHRLGRCVDYVVTFNRSATGNVTYDAPKAYVGNLRFFEL